MPVIRPPAFLIGTGMAQFLDELCGAVVQAMEVVAFFLLHTPPCVTVDTSQSSVQVPASKSSN
jgi:hypothetical protein